MLAGCEWSSQFVSVELGGSQKNLDLTGLCAREQFMVESAH
jgi:hypothetical protein